MQLSETIKEPDVVLCFDRFFSSVNLFQDIKFAAVGTCIRNGKNIPKDITKLDRGDSKFLCNENKTLFIRWQDTKEVLVLTNCHSDDTVLVKRKQKNGEKIDMHCPKAISFYNQYMGGVDLADQMSTLYDMKSKSCKWWKKIIYRLLMISAVNSKIIY